MKRKEFLKIAIKWKKELSDENWDDFSCNKLEYLTKKNSMVKDYYRVFLHKHLNDNLLSERLYGYYHDELITLVRESLVHAFIEEVLTTKAYKEF